MTRDRQVPGAALGVKVVIYIRTPDDPYIYISVWYT